MNLQIREEPIGSLREHAEIPIAYLVDKILEVSVSDGGLGGIILQERAVDAPYIKDYDAIKGLFANERGRVDVSGLNVKG